MPRQVDEAMKADKWNFYFPKLMKLEYMHMLLNNGLQGKQSAAIRALIRLFIAGKIPMTEVKALIEEETVITEAGKVSKL